MKILIVEDDLYKSEDVESFIKKEFPNIEIFFGKSYQSGLQKALSRHFDLMLVDMSIPNFDIKDNEDGGTALKNGGELILRELLDENIDFKSAIITQYETFNGETIEEIDNRLKEDCGNKYLGCIKYSAWNDDWKEYLKTTIDNVIHFSNR